MIFFDMDKITCKNTLKLACGATMDAACCFTCCCFCGGCCGRYRAAAVDVLASLDETIVEGEKPGTERCMTTCMVQSAAGVIMPFTLCACLWFCFGLATPCAKFCVRCVLDVEKSAAAVEPPVQQMMCRASR